MNTFQAHHCWRNAECTQCYDKISLLLTKCLDSSKGSKHCHEVYKPHLCWPFDDCTVCVNQLLRAAAFCNKDSSNKLLCSYGIKDCSEECRKNN